MDAKTLFSVVLFLDDEQVGRFRNWIDGQQRRGGGQAKYMKLFERMRSMDHFDDAEIRAKEFIKPSTYYENRKILLNKLIQCFAEDKIDSYRDIAFIQSAIELSAFGIARQKVTQLFSEALDSNNSQLAYLLADLRFRTLSDYNQDLFENIDPVHYNHIIERSTHDNK